MIKVQNKSHIDIYPCIVFYITQVFWVSILILDIVYVGIHFCCVLFFVPWNSFSEYNKFTSFSSFLSHNVPL